MHTNFPFVNDQDLKKYCVNYDCNLNDMSDIIDQYGFVVVLNVLTPEDLKCAEAALGLDLLDIVNHPDNSSSEDESIRSSYQFLSSLKNESHLIPKLFPCLSFDNKSHSFSHGRFAWQIRTNARVKYVYECLYPCQPLVCGLDQPFFSPNFDPDTKDHGYWGHADQNLLENHDSNASDFRDWRVFQSIVQIWPSVDETHWTTAILPKSHKDIYPSLMSNAANDFARDPSLNMQTGHFIPLSAFASAEVNKYYVDNTFQIPLPAGSMIVWDSKTIHQGCKSKVAKRLAMPVCWEPRSRRDIAAWRRKMLLSASGRASTHWASLGNRHYNQQLNSTIHVATPAIPNSDPKKVQLAMCASLRPVTLKDDIATEEANEHNHIIANMIMKLDMYEDFRSSYEEYAEILTEDDGNYLETLLKPEYVNEIL